jgi:hypothetical protein
MSITKIVTIAASVAQDFGDRTSIVSEKKPVGSSQFELMHMPRLTSWQQSPQVLLSIINHLE